MRHGFLLVHKPIGPTSHDAVSAVRKRLNEKNVGHLGTLDPAASGLLVLAVGSKALKVIEYFSNLPKEYEAEVTFGSVSSTYDREGVIEPITPKPGWTVPDHITLRRLIDDRFVGTIDQVPPLHSAIHVAGQRAYDLARKGQIASLKARTVQIDRCEIMSYEYPLLRLRVACGSGTYIRSLAHDLGQMIRSGGYLSALHRTMVGAWNVADAVLPTEAEWTNVIPLKEILKDFHGIDVTDAEAADLGFGRTIAHEVKPGTIAWNNGLPIAILIPAKDGGRGARPKKVL